MVIYRGSDGKPGYHQTDDIHDAVGFVEQMRNEQGVEHARIFRLEEVVFQYKPYYRVELADSMGSAEDESPDDEQPAVTSGESSSLSNGNGDHNTSNRHGNSESEAKGGDDAGPAESLSGTDSPSASESSVSTIGDVVTGPGAKRSLFGR